jgi:CRP-like cAMP-binding protein
MVSEMRDMEFKILGGLSREEASPFFSLCRKNKYPDGTCLFKERTEARTFYLVLDGSIELRFEMPGKRNADGTLITTQGSGEAVGWSVLIPPFKYSLSGYCRRETTVLEIDKADFSALFPSNYRLAYIIMRNVGALIGERLARMEDALAKCLGEEIMSEW